MVFSELVRGDRASEGAVCVREADGLVECAILAVRKTGSSFGYRISERRESSKTFDTNCWLCVKVKYIWVSYMSYVVDKFSGRVLPWLAWVL